MPFRIRGCSKRASSGAALAPLHRDEKHPRARLGDKARGVDDNRAEPVVLNSKAPTRSRRNPFLSVGRETTVHVLQDDRARRASCLCKPAHELPEWPESTRPRDGSCQFLGRGLCIPRRAKGPGRERTPMRGQFLQTARSSNVSLATSSCLMSRLTIVADIGCNFHRIEVIGELAIPGLAEASPGHASASEKFQESQLTFTHRRHAECRTMIRAMFGPLGELKRRPV